MDMSLEVIESEALKLSSRDRQHLLERLMFSLDVDTELDAEWFAEAERRDAEINSGLVNCISGNDALLRLRATLDALDLNQ